MEPLLRLREILASQPDFEQEVAELAATEGDRARDILLDRKVHHYLLTYGTEDAYDKKALGERLDP